MDQIHGLSDRRRFGKCVELRVDELEKENLYVQSIEEFCMFSFMSGREGQCVVVSYDHQRRSETCDR